MKKKTLFLLMVLFACGIGQITADEVKMAYTGSSTINMTGNNDAATVGLDASSWSVVGDKGGNGSYPGLNKARQIRLYGAETNHNFVTVTATAGQTISSVTVTYGTSNYNAKVTVNGSEITGTGTNTEKTYEINGSSFSIAHNYSTSTQVYIISAEITYSSPGKLQSIAVSGTPTKTEYYIGDSFDPAGLTVTGTYESGDKKEITTGITWTCNPETFNDLTDAASVTVTAKVGDIESEEYTVNKITVIEKPYFFYESFDKCDGTGGVESWSGSIASSAIEDNTYFDNTVWTYENAYIANKCAKFGKGSKGKGSAETPTIDCKDAKAVCLTFKAGAWNATDEKTTLNISATNGTISTKSVTMKKGEWTEYKLYVYNITGSLKIKFEGASTSSSRFFLDEVMVSKPTATISEAKYATLCLPFNFTVPEGVTAYTAEVNDEQNFVNITAIDEEAVIPAGMGIIISGEPGSYTFTGTTDDATVGNDNNDLVGVTEDTELTGGYILALDENDNNKVKFFQIDPNNNELGAYKAYLNYTGSANALGIRVNDATGIRTIEAQAANQYFDLMGRKVQNPERGIYILNGKKVYVK